jgi:TonB family protein
MFEVPKSRSLKRNASVLASFLIQSLLVYVWIARPPLFVKPSSMAWGMHGRSEKITYFPQTTESSLTSKKPLIQLKAPDKPPKESPKKKEEIESARAGVPDGSLSQGPDSGSEAKPALPVVFPDPAVFPWQLPKGLQGDVIVEVTIDAQGSVTETRVLQSLKEDIDEKVIATLRNWRFRPATVDGVAIRSRQDVHFHFPS